MELKELIREKGFAEIIAERAGIILMQHEQLTAMQKESEAKGLEITRLQEKVKELEGTIICMKEE